MLPIMYDHFGVEAQSENDGLGEETASKISPREEDLLPYIDNTFVYAFLDDPFGKQRRRNFENDIEYDGWGVGWDMHQEGIFMVNHPLQHDPDLSSYTIPDPDDPALLKYVPALVEQYGDTHLVCSYQVFGLNERTSALRGYSEWFMDLGLDPAFAHKLLDEITEYQVELARNYIKQGVCCGRVGDDYGMQSGMMMSVDMFREFFKPCLKKIFSVYKDAGLPLVYHSCGDIRPIIADMIEIGVDVLNNCQPEAMPREELADKFGDTGLVFYGGISAQHVLQIGTREAIGNELDSCLETLGRNGRWIMSPGISITSDVKPGAVDILIEEIEKRR
jgi:uroporphyrinogen decarboxylase